MYGSTISAPAEQQKAGFQVGTRKYVWMFPAEMEVTAHPVKSILESEHEFGSHTDSDYLPAAVFKRSNYDAECSYSPDGRFVLYAHIEDHKEGEKPDANIYIYDLKSSKHYPIVTAKGYDGGPFFSPDGKSICYRSDRKGNDLLQLFVADLKFKDGVPIGVEKEYQLTDNRHVNWCPYWHPSGKYLVYGTSEVSHSNYEVFAIECDMEALRAGKKPSELKHVRITQADGADILPSFTNDGKLMMWTSQRGPKLESEDRPSSQLWLAEWIGDPFSLPAQLDASAAPATPGKHP
jgi:tricorn protease-like protein